MEPEGSSPYLQQPATCPNPELRSYRMIILIPKLLAIFRNMISFL
jgi:hypothetical protein